MPGHIRNLNDLWLHMCKSLPFILYSILFSKLTHPLMSIDPPWLRLPHSCASDSAVVADPDDLLPHGSAPQPRRLGKIVWSSASTCWFFCIPLTFAFTPLEALVPLFGVNLGVASLLMLTSRFHVNKRIRWPCLWMFLSLCQDLQHVLGAGMTEPVFCWTLWASCLHRKSSL